MTATERAEEIGEYWTTDMGKGFYPPQAMINDIAAAIEAAEREAVMAFKARVLSMLENIKPEGDWFYNKEQGSYWEEDWQKTVQAAIRQVKEMEVAAP